MIKLAVRRILTAVGRLILVVGLVAAIVVGLIGMERLGRPRAAPIAGPLPEEVLEPAAVPPGTAAPPPRRPLPVPPVETGIDPVRAWANEVAVAVDIPARAIVSYVNADMAMRSHQPGCQLSWTTLAGIGRIESDHGRFAGALLGENALPSVPIIGIALDGGPGVRAIGDTDGGVLDGDPVYDRAVGPMQFIPSTWQRWATDASGDGVGDPQNLDDAAMAAARYLCADGRDLTTGDGWWAGVLSYNNSVDYGQKVFRLAETYAHAGTSAR